VDEMRRVTRRRIVMLTFDPDYISRYWLVRDYLPEIAVQDEKRFPPLTVVAEALGGAQATSVPIAADCTDGFLCGAWMRPLSYLDETVRANISSFALLDPATLAAALARLEQDVADGTWAERNADLIAQDEADFGFASTGLPASHRVLAPALGGGGLLDIGIYPLNFAAFVLGEITGVQADAALGPTGVDVHTVFNLRHAGNRLSQGMCSLSSTTGCHATVLGTDGHIEVSPPFYAAQQLRLARGARPWEETPVEVIDRPWRGTRYVAQVEEVHRCLRAGLSESPVMTLDETVALVGWMDTMRAQFGLRYPGE